MEITAGTCDLLPVGLMDALARYRHRVFVERLGWDLPSSGGMELDQFDRADTLYVIARRPSDGELIGTARLLPTEQPYLLGEIFPQLMGGLAPPRNPLVWELSRFACVDFSATGGGSVRQFSSAMSLGLLRATLCVASTAGARQLISVSPLGVERILRRGGFRARRAAPPLIVDGHALFACWIDVDPCAQGRYGPPTHLAVPAPQALRDPRPHSVFQACSRVHHWRADGHTTASEAI